MKYYCNIQQSCSTQHRGDIDRDLRLLAGSPQNTWLAELNEKRGNNRCLAISNDIDRLHLNSRTFSKVSTEMANKVDQFDVGGTL
jgi:hypothetical protein